MNAMETALPSFGSPQKQPALPTLDEDQPAEGSFTLPAQLDVGDASRALGRDDDDDDEVCFTPGGSGPAGIGEPLTPEAASNVVKQIEFYFSDASLPTDKKLLKQIRKDPNGFVPVKMFANFRKVRAITRDPEAISLALKESKELAISEDGKQVRRIVPVPAEYDIEDIQKRTVVVENLPLGSTIESVTKLMKQYGNVKLVRICNRETKGKLPLWLTSSLGSVVLQSTPSMGMGGGLVSQPSEKPPHAYVEYESEDEAVMAVAALHDTEGWRPLGINVHHLIYECSDTPKPQQLLRSQQSMQRGLGRTNSLAPRRSNNAVGGGLMPTMSERPAGGNWRAPLVHPGPGGASWGVGSGGPSGGLNKPRGSVAMESMASSGTNGSIPATRSQAGSLGGSANVTGHNSVASTTSEQQQVGSPSKGRAYVPPALRGMDSMRMGSASPPMPGSPMRGGSGTPGSPLRSSAAKGALFAPPPVNASSHTATATGAPSPKPTLTSANSMLRSDAPEWSPPKHTSANTSLQPSVVPSAAGSNIVPASPFEVGLSPSPGASPAKDTGLRSQLVNASFTGLSVFGKQAQLQAQLQAAQRATSQGLSTDAAGEQDELVSEMPARANTASGGVASPTKAAAAAASSMLNPSQLSLKPIKTGTENSPAGSPAVGGPSSPAAATAGSDTTGYSRGSPSGSASGRAGGSPLHHAAVTAAAAAASQLTSRGSGSAPKFVLDLPPGTNQPNQPRGSPVKSRAGSMSSGSGGSPLAAQSQPSQLRAFGSLMEPAQTGGSNAQLQFQSLSPTVRNGSGTGGAINPFGSGQFLSEVGDIVTKLIPSTTTTTTKDAAPAEAPAAGAAAAVPSATSVSAPTSPTAASAAPVLLTATAVDDSVVTPARSTTPNGLGAPKESMGKPPRPLAVSGLQPRASAGGPAAANSPAAAAAAGGGKEAGLRSHQSFPLQRTSSAGGHAGDESDNDSGEEQQDAAAAAAAGGAADGSGAAPAKRRRKRGSRAGSRSRRNSLASGGEGGNPPVGVSPRNSASKGGLAHRHSVPEGVASGAGSTASTPEHHLAMRHSGKHGVAALRKDAAAGAGSDSGSASASAGGAREPRQRRHSKPDYASWAAATAEYRAESIKLAHAGGAGHGTPPRSPRHSMNPAGQAAPEAAAGAGSTGPATPPHHHAGGPSQGGLVVVAHGPDGTRGFAARGRGQPLPAPPPA